MPATLVPTVRTSYTQTQLIQGFIEGWQQLYGELPKKESIAVIYAQNAIETGSTTSMWNNNVGNVKFIASQNPSDDDGKDYMMLANVWEIINGQKVMFQPPSPATWFRSFPNLAAGVAFHFGFLKNNRYKQAWAAVEAGDPANFAHLLKLAGYYTAPEADYVRAVNAYFNKFMKDQTFETVVASLETTAPPLQPFITPDPIAEPDPIEPPTPVEVPAPVAVVPSKNVFQTVVDLITSLFSVFTKK